MSQSVEQTVAEICSKHGGDKTRMMDIVRDIQKELGQVSSKAMALIAANCGTHRVEVESVVTFYAFLNREKKGNVVIRLCNDVPDMLAGAAAVGAAFEKALGIKMGGTTPDGAITLEWTPCIGVSDQAPAALINDEIFTNISTDKAQEIVARLKDGITPKQLVRTYGDGNNANDLVKSMVNNNVRLKGDVLFAPYTAGKAIKESMAMSPQEVIRDIKTARLRGRGGAGFPTGMKWEFTRSADNTDRTIICNADEGEPGTFKDRILLTETPDQLFEGMTIAAYAIGAQTGIVYLRAEYEYLRDYLEEILKARREANLLGSNICGKTGFSFDIRIQMGAGAYICGEETALISSCEGLRGDPKNRPPFPAQKGYLGTPTDVNNVETFCCIPPIIENGPAWFAQKGSKGSPGTKLLSISGDCAKPGVYEFEFGVKISDVLEACGASDTYAVQIGGPSGQMIGEADFGRTVCYDDLATGGSMMIFDKTRNVLDIAKQFMEFFIEESCGYCTPCRVGNRLVMERLELILAGHGSKDDLAYLEEICSTVKTASRCGLGQTSTNPVASTLKNFRSEYEKLIAEKTGTFLPRFDIAAAVAPGEAITGRDSVIFSK